MKAAIYVRISHDPSGKAAGVRRQQDDCVELAERRGIEVVEVFRDNNVPATKRAKRLGWQAMLDGLARKDFDSVIAWANDRMYRSSEVRLELMRAVQKSRGRIITVKDGEMNPSDASGRMAMGILGEVAEFERERQSERQVTRWEQRKKDGKLSILGRRPFGYRRVDDHLEVVPEEAAVIRECVERLIAGDTLYQLVVHLRERDVRTSRGNGWTPSSLRKMLLKPYLVGEGKLVPAILKADERRLLEARLNAQPRQPGKPTGRRYAASNLLVCGVCGAKLGGGQGKYRCGQARGGRGCVSIKATDLERFLLESAVVRVLSKPRRKSKGANDVDVGPVLAELAEIEERIMRAQDDYADGVFDAAGYGRVTGRLDARRLELSAKIADARPSVPTVRAGVTVRDGKAFLGAVGLDAPDFQRRWDERELTEAEVVTLSTILAQDIESATVKPVGKSAGSRGFDPARVAIHWR